MRDLLEELLDGQEDETREAPARWEEPPVVLRRRGAREEAGEAGTEGGLPRPPWIDAAARGAEAPHTRPEGREGRSAAAEQTEAAHRGAAEGAKPAAAGGGGQLWAPAPAVPGIGTGAEGLYRKLLRTGRAAGYVRRDMGAAALSHPGAEERGPAPGAAELDLIFQRDARRYDGGFPLY